MLYVQLSFSTGPAQPKGRSPRKTFISRIRPATVHQLVFVRLGRPFGRWLLLRCSHGSPFVNDELVASGDYRLKLGK